ncbi:unnamed protein product [Discula destructiva]
MPTVGRNTSIRPTLLPLALVRNASRLSSIHAGLWRSERARPQGPSSPSPKLEIRQPRTAKPYLSPEERRKERAIARQNPITFKIKKGKKNITAPAGPGRIRTSRRWTDPRDSLGSGSLLKKFRTGQLLKELNEADESKGEHLQHDDFARQLVAGDVESLMTQFKRPNVLRRSRSKSHYEKVDLPKGMPQFRRQEQDSDRRARAADSFVREWRDGEVSYGRSGDDRGTPRDADRFPGRREPYHREPSNDPALEAALMRGAALAREAGRLDNPVRREPVAKAIPSGVNLARETGSSDRAERRGSDREISYKGRGHDSPGLNQRDSGNSSLHAHDQQSSDMFRLERTPSSNIEEAPGRVSRVSRPEDSRSADSPGDMVEQGAGETKERPKKKYQPPPSVTYTTAASQFLYGTSTVEAALTSSRRKLYKLYIHQGSKRSWQDKDDYLAHLAFKKDVPVEWLGDDQVALLNRMSSSRPHNGYVLEASPLPLLPVRALGEVSEEQSWPGFKVERGYQSAEDAAINGTSDFIVTEPSTHKPFVLLLNEILDPQNLGAIIRTASFMGVSAIATSKSGSAPVTPVVLKTSSGAAETMTMLTVDTPVDFVNQSKSNGWRVYAAVPPKPEPGRRQVDVLQVEKSDPLSTEPCILVLGSEGEGLSRQLRRCAHSEVSIPNMSGSNIVDSLNVGVATGLLCSSFVRGRNMMQNNLVRVPKALF